MFGALFLRTDGAHALPTPRTGAGTWATWCPQFGESSRVSPDHFDYFQKATPDTHGACGRRLAAGLS